MNQYKLILLVGIIISIFCKCKKTDYCEFPCKSVNDIQKLSWLYSFTDTCNNFEWPYEIVIRSQNEYDSLFCSGQPFGDINFNEKSVIGHSYDYKGEGSGAHKKYKICRIDSIKQVTSFINITVSKGSIKSLYFDVEIWISVPAVPNDYNVNFEVCID